MTRDNTQEDGWFMYLNKSLISLNNYHQNIQAILSVEKLELRRMMGETGVKKDDGSKCISVAILHDLERLHDFFKF